ncbi:MAG: sulfotransferase domain-containing protein [Chitinophagales bacterium]
MKKIDLIYILGVSYSGSTLLSYLIGSSKQVCNLGELKQIKEKREKNPNRLCTCGQEIPNCSFWSKYENVYTPYIEESLLRKIKIALKILLKRDLIANQLSDTQDHKILHHMQKDQKQEEGMYMLDASKSLWRLAYLMNCKNINLKVIYIDMNIESNVASFAKRNYRGFWEGLLIYKLQHFLVKRFLSYHSNMDYLVVDYAELSQNTSSTMNQIGDFLGVSYDNYVEQLKKRTYHVTTGNTGVTTQFRNGFKMQKNDDKWKSILSPFQKTVLKIVK